MPFSVVSVFLALVLSAPAHAQAQAYPAKPIRFVVPYPAGAEADKYARVVKASGAKAD